MIFILLLIPSVLIFIKNILISIYSFVRANFILTILGVFSLWSFGEIRSLRRRIRDLEQRLEGLKEMVEGIGSSQK
jgi:hypothetical protein